tara:strand:- start:139008 stop:139775 length:768 start_codon:yes stop_codon:yes gene_type:complete
MTDKTETPKTDHEHVLTLVQSLYNRAYADKPDAVPFEPSDTLAGLIDQLDNMLVGVLDEREELTKENKQLRKNQLDLFDSLDTSSHELASLIEHVNNELSNNISSADTEPPEYLDAETPYKAYHLLMDILPFISTHGEDTNHLVERMYTRRTASHAKLPTPLPIHDPEMYKRCAEKTKHAIDEWRLRIHAHDQTYLETTLKFRALASTQLHLLYQQMACPHNDTRVTEYPDVPDKTFTCVKCHASYTDSGATSHE